MRVVTATWKFPDPTEQFVVRKIAGLVERGVECTVVAEQVLDRARLATALPADRVAVTGSPIALRNADVVHFEHAGVALKHRRSLAEIRGATVVTCHGSDVRFEGLGKDWVEEGFADVFSWVDRIHCVSEELAEHCVRLGARPDQLYVAPVGVDLRTFTQHRRTQRPDGLALRLVSIGRLDWVKGYEYALHAVRILRDAGVRVSYTIVGIDEGAEASVRLAMRDFGLDDIVSLTGHLTPSGVRDALAGSDVFVLSSVSEGSSIATMEAMAMGLPVVVTDVGGTRDIVQDGTHGFLVPARDPGAIAAAVMKLRSREVRREMGDKGAVDVQRFDSTAQLDRLVGLYEELVDRAAASRGDADDGDLVSVVIAARNATATIEDQLRALSLQHYDRPWEVVVVDNASSDGTREMVLAWRSMLPGLRVIDAPDRPSIAYARNVGVRAALGQRVVMCDADDVVAPDWLSNLAGTLDHAPIACGALERRRLVPAHVAAGPELDTQLGVAENFRPRVLTGNLGFHREVFDAVGGFDEDLRRGCDLDFGWRAIDAGFTPAFAGDAVVHYRSQWRFLAVVGRAYRDGQAGPALYVRHGERGLLPPSAAAVRARYAFVARGFLRDAWVSRLRVEWAYDLGFSAGRIVGSLRNGTRFL